MGISGGPYITRDSSLILDLDATDLNSFNGEPTINLAPNPNFVLGTTGWSVNQSVTLTTASFSDGTYLIVQCNQSSSTPGFLSTANIPVQAATSYSLSLTGYRNSFGDAYLYASGDGTGGTNIVWGATIPRPLTTTLTTISASFVTPSDMTNLKIGALWGFSVNATTSSIMYIKNIQLEQKSYPTPFVSGTRGPSVSTGGGWRDLSGNNNNGTFAFSGSSANYPISTYTSTNNRFITFDGVGSYVDLGTNIQLSNNFTLNVWIRGTNTGFILDQGPTGSDPTGCLEWNTLGLTLGSNNIANASTSITGFNTAVWNNVCVTFFSGSTNFYVNGALLNKQIAPFATFQPVGTLKIGRRSLNNTAALLGSIGSLLIYNRVLSADEVAQNFNASKGRFDKEQAIATSYLTLNQAASIGIINDDLELTPYLTTYVDYPSASGVAIVKSPSI
jgi:hypothetical protein